MHRASLSVYQLCKPRQSAEHKLIRSRCNPDQSEKQERTCSSWCASVCLCVCECASHVFRSSHVSPIVCTYHTCIRFRLSGISPSRPSVHVPRTRLRATLASAPATVIGEARATRGGCQARTGRDSRALPEVHWVSRAGADHPALLNRRGVQT